MRRVAVKATKSQFKVYSLKFQEPKGLFQVYSFRNSKLPFLVSLTYSRSCWVRSTMCSF